MLRCVVYTRVSTEHGLEQEFNSLDNQREASEAYVKSQTHEGWRLIRARYDDGGYSGGSMDRPALKKLLDDIRAHRIDVIVPPAAGAAVQTAAAGDVGPPAARVACDGSPSPQVLASEPLFEGGLASRSLGGRPRQPSPDSSA